MPSANSIARSLAAAMLAGDLETEQLVERSSRVLGKRWRWLRPVCRRVADRFAGQPHPRHGEVARFLLSDSGFRNAAAGNNLRLCNVLISDSNTMRPVVAARPWQLPSICTAADLADWLQVTMSELEWFADRRLLESKSSQGRLRHYNYRPLAKRFGQIRLIESPKQRLKQIQRRVLSGILDRIPPHWAAHGFRRGRSITTFAACHVGQRLVLRIDLNDFFPSISVARIRAIFRTVGYPEPVADLLAGLCTNAAPMDIWRQGRLAALKPQSRDVRWLYAKPHLPQGAPTSPALANLAAYRLDSRLAGLARSANAAYTRYADDLAFSGQHDFERVAKRFHLHVCASVMEERFRIHHRKTRFMRRGVRQRLASLTVNQHLNVSRQEFDRLKATLTNCIRFGAANQNRHAHQDYRGHLEGRLSFVEMVNPGKGRRLRNLFEQIEW